MNKRLFLLTLAVILGLPSFIWLFMYDWKIALPLFCILWGNNIQNDL